MPRSTSSNLQLWSERFEQFSQRHQTVQQFCDSLSCTEATFYYWKRKLESSGQTTNRPGPAAASAFVPVVLRGNSSRPVVVRVKDGTQVSVPVDALGALQVILQHAQRVAG